MKAFLLLVACVQFTAIGYLAFERGDIALGGVACLLSGCMAYYYTEATRHR